MTIPTNLIENALNLTGKTKYYVYHTEYDKEWKKYDSNFSMEKFCLYLLSPSFIEKYYSSQRPGYIPEKATLELIAGEFGYAISEYQRKDKEFPDGNPGPLIDLLTKIPGQKTNL